jgi:UDP-N-acetyl-2-amino-2-deoxyglucuronate dehydrogenase
VQGLRHEVQARRRQAEANLSSDKTFRVALVGCGRISKNHLEAIDQIDGLELVAVCDTDPERAERVGAEWKVKHFTSYEKMLKDTKADVVTIATPSGLHADQGVAAAQAGKHVVMEKPMAISLTGADALVHACDKAEVQLFVVKQNRLNPPVQLLKRAVDRNRFGRIYMASCTVHWARPQEYYDQAPWRGTWEFDGGAFMNQASHYVDLIQWVMGPVESVMAKTATLARRIETEDSGIAILKFRSGALGSIQVTMLAYPRNLEGSLTILGEKGSAKIGGTAVNKIEHWEFAEYDEDDKLVEAANTNPPYVYGLGHQGYYRNVLSVLRGEAKPDTDGRAGRKSLELILGIYESAKTGREVPLPLRAQV